MCHIVYQVVVARFPQSALLAVQMIVFLRFLNPALVSPYEFQLVNARPSADKRRTLMLITKIIQVPSGYGSLGYCSASRPSRTGRRA